MKALSHGMEIRRERKKQEAALEAVLFAVGDSVEEKQLAELIGESPKKTHQILEEMKIRWQEEERGVTLVCLDRSWQMCTRPELYEYLIKVAKAPRKYTLSDTLLETLSIIAYKQPVTKLDVERIRGVNCDHAINRLVEFDLVMELGRLDAPGRPLLFGTTEQFLRTFGVGSLEELPELTPVEVEEFKEQAEQEAALQLET